MYKVVGWRDVKFRGKDGEDVSGLTMYLTYRSNSIYGEGTEKVFITHKRLAEAQYEPVLGDEINVWFSKSGKVQSITRL